MAIETRQVTEGYAEAVEYIRRLCEGEDVDGGKPTEVNGTANGGTTNGTAGGSANGAGHRVSVASSAISLSPTRKATIVHSPPRVNGLGVVVGSPSAVFAASQTKQGAATLRSRTKTSAQDGKSHDSCDACGQPGQFILCDRCPRVFHFLCAEPPVAFETLATMDKWFCRECSFRESRKRKSRAHAKNIFYPLISSMEYINPRAFAVPEEIRRQFDGIEADADGTFVNTREERAQRVNGGDANRDFTRLTTDHGDTILCYRCGLSALHGPVVRCDYCPLSWHWDCLDPPLSGPPAPLKRWMCPNHADHALRRRHNRFRKERIVDLTNAPDDARNSGVIDVIDDEPPVELADPKVKFRVPATLIRRQFELRVQRDRQQRSGQISPGTGSPLTDDSSPVIDGKSNGATEPSPGARQSNGLESGPVALAEWLQSIVSFQQDVAQFVMATHNTTQDASSPGTGHVDKMQMLTDIAASVLNPPAALPAAQSNRAAPKSDQATTPNASVGSISAKSDNTRLGGFLVQHGLSRQDLQQALDEIIDGNYGDDGGSDQDDVGVATLGSKSPQPAAEDTGLVGIKRRRAGTDDDMDAGCSAVDANGAKQARMQLRSMRNAGGGEVAELVRRLLAEKGSDAIIDFLFST